MESWKKAITDEWNTRLKGQVRDLNQFPLIDQTFDSEEILSVVEVIMSGQLTMSKNVKNFETAFAKYVGAPYAVMVNSGSSANLIALAAAANPIRKNCLKPGDEVLVPAVCWSTSVWPLFQMSLKPVFVDVDPLTLNMSMNDLRNKISSKTKAVMAVHILGNSTAMEDLLSFCKEKNLLLIEDTCESLGSLYGNKFLGTLGAFGTYSFYYSHHMTTGEGGMITCQTEEDYDLLKCLRAHGWTRELSNRQELEKKYNSVDPRFLFVNVGYNVRPMEVQGALGICQLKKIDEMNATRVYNRNTLIQRMKAHPQWKDQFVFINEAPGTKPIWFGFCCLLNPKYSGQQREFLTYLSAHGIENRPIVSGNFVRQPALKTFGVELNPLDFPVAEKVDKEGFFIGLHTHKLSDQQLQRLTDVMLNAPIF